MSNNSTNSIHDLTAKGLEESQHVSGSPRVLVNQLKAILARNKKEAKDDEKKQTELIQSLKGETAALDQLITDLKNQIPAFQKEITERHNKIETITIARDAEIAAVSDDIHRKNTEIDKFIKSIKDFTSYVEDPEKGKKGNTENGEIKDETEYNTDHSSSSEKGHSPPDKPNKFAFNVIFAIWIMLTGSLFFFYSSTLYSVFLRDVTQEAQLERRIEGAGPSAPVPSKIIAVINLDYFGRIWEKASLDSPSSIMVGLTETFFIIFFPSLVIASGALIFIFKKFKWKSVWLSLTYTLTFVFDVYLAYHIVKRIYEAYYVLAQRAPEEYVGFTRPWELSMALDNTFGLVLMIGFVGYVVWGVLFDRIVTTKDRFEPLNNQILLRQKDIEFLHTRKENIESAKHLQIQNETDRIESLDNRIIAIQEKIIANESLKTAKQKEIESINNKVFINVAKLEYEVFTYVFGWIRYLSTKTETKERSRLIEDCIEMRDGFLDTINTATKFMEVEPE